MSLSVFIKSNVPKIVEEWEMFARSLIPASDHMTPLALRNHILDILNFVIGDMTSARQGPNRKKNHKVRVPSWKRSSQALPKRTPPYAWRAASISTRWLQNIALFVPA